jgi:FtsP/CotA-like multicopper oxidase with cupredoxin domain
MFDVDGQLFFPAGVPFVPNPEHPYWVPEFIGDVILVNGESWPYLEVPRRPVRFLLVNGSNARTYSLSLDAMPPASSGPVIWQIGTDGGYLDRPVAIGEGRPIERLLLMPGERAVVIVDFAHVRRGTRLMLRNVARAPYPSGEAAHGRTTGRVMQLRVVGERHAAASYDPASGDPLRPPMVRLADPATGAVAPDVDVRVVRQLTLNEVIGDPSTFAAVAYEGGPLEVLVNNTEYPGDSFRPYGDFVPVTVGGATSYYSELPDEGTTEVWDIVNMTADAHPIHLHLAQFQLVNRQRFDVRSYAAEYAASVPGGVEPTSGTVYPPATYIPGFGPPYDYRADRNPVGGGKAGGNPDVTPYLRGPVQPPPANEAGWKDTIRAMPGEVTRIVVRWAPTSLPADTPAADATYAFDPDGGHGYVWHCHIIDHEDNEMMRPTSIVANPSAVRTYVQGVDY